MRKLLLSVLTLSLACVYSVSAQTYGNNVWNAAKYANTTVAGSPECADPAGAFPLGNFGVLSNPNNISIDWLGSDACGNLTGSDNFSTSFRMSRNYTGSNRGWYNITYAANDGIRISSNGGSSWDIVDLFTIGGTQAGTVNNVPLQGSGRLMRVDQVEGTGHASVDVTFTCLAAVAGTAAISTNACEDSTVSATLTLSGYTGFIQWQESTTGPTGTFTDVVDDTTDNETIMPTVTTWYRAEVTSCGTAVSNVVQRRVNPVVTLVLVDDAAVSCEAPFNLSGASPAGGVWSGTGITDGNAGTFDPSIGPGGSPYTITYTYTDANGCSAFATDLMTVTDDVTPPTMVCQDITIQLDAGGSVTIVAADVDGGSTDDCGPPTLSATPLSFGCAEVGINLVTLTGTDAATNSANCTASVSVQDNIAPTALCVATYTVNLDGSGNGSITPGDIDAGSSDACGIASLSVAPNAFTCADIGTQATTLTVTDNNSNIGSCSASVTIQDLEDPMAVCQDITVQLDASGNQNITGADLDGGSTDNCGISFLTPTDNAFNCADVGSATVTLIVIDNSSNSGSCTAVVTVEDNVPPTAFCNNITVQLDATGSASITPGDIDGGSSDACGIGSLSVSTSSFSCSDLGANTVTLTVEDNNGNTATCNATVEIEDDIDPMITCAADVVASTGSGTCEAFVTVPAPLVTDNCGSPLTSSSFAGGSGAIPDNSPGTPLTDDIVISGTSGTIVNITVDVDVSHSWVGDIDITLTSPDGTDISLMDRPGVPAGAVGCADNDFTITFDDASGFSAAALEARCGFAPWYVGDAQSIDALAGLSGENVDGTWTLSVADNAAGDLGTLNSWALNIDFAGARMASNRFESNLAANRTVSFDLSEHASRTAADKENATPVGFAARALVTLTNSYNGTSDASDTYPIGTTTITWTATDTAGNTATCDQDITVVDNEAPIALCMDATVQLDAVGSATVAVVDIDAGSTDACGITSLLLDITGFDCNDKGDNTVVLFAIDAQGNAGSCTATVTVEDNIAPMITCGADVTQTADIGSCSALVTVPGPIVMDNCDDTLGISTVSETGNSGVAISNLDPPACNTITVPGTGGTVLDVEVSVDISHTWIGDFNVSLQSPDGTTIILIDNNCSDDDLDITFSDAAIATHTDLNNECVGSPAVGVTFPASGSYQPLNALSGVDGQTAAGDWILCVDDNVGGDDGVFNSWTLTLTSSGIGNRGQETITYSSGSIADAGSYDYMANASNSPEEKAAVANSRRSTVVNGVAMRGLLAVTNSYNGTDDATDVYPVGTTVVTWTVTDESGNTATCDQNVTVTDDESPVALCQNVTVQLDGSGNASVVAGDIDAGSTDNCAVTGLALDVTSFNCGDVGSNTVTLTATDAAGNAGSCTAVVFVEDDEAPVLAPCPANITQSSSSTACGSNVTFTLPTATDNCAGTVVTATAPSGTFFPIGTTTVTVTATDPSGNTDDCSFDITIVDDVNPIVICPADITVSAPVGRCENEVSWFSPTASDNCPGVGITSATHLPGATFPVGMTTVTYEATDASGNIGSCSFTVTVTDDEDPMITCTDVTIYLDAIGSATVTAADVVGSASDNCSIVDTTLQQSTFDCAEIGSNTVFVNVSDPSGNIGSCTATVVVLDTIPPTITCPADIVAGNDIGSCSAFVSVPVPMSMDNCGSGTATQTNDYNGTANASDVYPLGTTTVTWTITDGSGNSTSCTMDVTVNDVEAPELTCTDVTVDNDPGECGATISVPAPFVEDNCDDFSNGTSGASAPGSAVSDLTGPACDAITISGSTGTVVDVQVSVDVSHTWVGDLTLTLQSPGGSTITLVERPGLATPTGCCGCSDDNMVIDFADGSGLDAVTLENTCPGGTWYSGPAEPVTAFATLVGEAVNGDWTLCVTDAQGGDDGTFNSWSIVIDDGITRIAASNTVNNERTAWDYRAAASANEAEKRAGGPVANAMRRAEVVLTNDFNGTDNITDEFFPVGTTVVVWTATDSSGNVGSCTSTVTVVDNEPPVVVCQDITVYLDASGSVSITDADVTASVTDNCGVGSATVTPSSFDCDATGDNTVVLEIADIYGNVGSCSATVTVLDTIPPMITCPADITVSNDIGSCSASVTVPQPEVMDNCLSFTGSGSSTPGTTTVDNATICDVIPISVGSATVTGVSVSVDITHSWVGDLTLTLQSPDGSTITLVERPGLATPTGCCGCSDDNMIIDFADGSGLDAVTLEATCPGGTWYSGPAEPVTAFATLAGESVDGNWTLCVSDGATGDGGFLNSWSIDIDYGTARIAASSDLTGQRRMPIDAGAVASVTEADKQLAQMQAMARRGDVTLTNSYNGTDDASDVYPVGTTVVTWTATDDSGNSSTCDMSITVEDTEAPIAVCQDITVQLDATGNVSITAGDIDNGSSDNCAIGSLTVTPSAFTCAEVGDNTVELLVTDIYGNSGSCTATVTVEDNIPPTVLCVDATVYLDATGNVSITTADVDGGTTDNCGIGSLTVTPSSFDCDETGSNTVTLSAIDDNGNSGSCTATVVVLDTIPPTITCPADIVAGNDIGSCSAFVSVPVPAFDDNCGDAGGGGGSGTTSDGSSPGTTTVDNATICDVIPISVGSATVTGVSVSVDITHTWVGDLTLTLQSPDGSTITLVERPGLATPTGCCGCSDDNMVIDFADGSGLDAVTLEATCPGGTWYSGPAEPVTAFATLAGESVDGNWTLCVSDGATGDGGTLNSWSIEIDYGTARIAASSDLTGQRRMAIDPGAVASVNEADKQLAQMQEMARRGVVTLTNDYNGTDDASDVYPLGTTTVTWTATDESGNSTSCTMDVTVNDVEAPELTCTDVTVDNDPGECGATISVPAPFVEDNCDDFSNGTSGASAPGSAVSDLTGPACDAITISGSTGTVVDVQVSVDVSHTWVGDLTLTLQSPGGSTITLVERPGLATPTGCCGCSDDNMVIDFADGSGLDAVTLENTCPGGTWYSGPAEPVTAFATLVGEAVNGDWTLCVTDAQGGDDGTFNSWSIVIDDGITRIAASNTVNNERTAWDYRAAASANEAEKRAGGPVANAMRRAEVVLTNDFNGTDNITDEFFPVGTTVVVWTATDSSGNVGSCTSTVTVVDNEPPVVVCQDITVYLDASGSVSITDADVTASVTDNCGVGSATVTPSSFDCDATGDNTVVLEIADIYGNVGSCSATVTVLDTIPPMITCPADITVSNDIGSCSASVTVPQPEVMDNCLSFTGSGSSTPGTTTVDNATICDVIPISVGSATVTGVSVSVDITHSWVGDLTLTLQSPDGSTITLVERPGLATPTGCCGCSDDNMVIDFADGSGLDAVTLEATCPGGTWYSGPAEPVTAFASLAGESVDGNWTLCVSDGAGGDGGFLNSWSIDIDYGTARIAASSDLTGQRRQAIDQGAVASVTEADKQLAQMQAMARRGDVTLTNSYNGTDDASDVYPVGTTVVTWTATDDSGNSSTCDMSITVEDTEAPIAVCQNVTVQLDDAGTASITAGDVDGGSTDNCSIETYDVVPMTFTCADIGSNSVVLTVTDPSGNAGSCTATVTVEDNVPPIVLCVDVTVYLDATGSASITTADVDGGTTDNCGIGSLTVTPSTFTCDDTGDNTVVLSAIDDNGNTGSCTATVTVLDTIAPTITCPADITVSNDIGSCSASVTVPQPEVMDNCLSSSLESGSSTPGTSTIDNATICDVIPISVGAATVTGVSVSVDITHTWVGDLTLTLQSPDGSTITLVERPGLATPTGCCGCSDDNMVIDFADGSGLDAVTLEATCPGGTWYSGPAEPVTAFATLAGESVDGNWTLCVSDGAGGDGGFLNSWSIDIDYGTARIAASSDLTGQRRQAIDQGAVASVTEADKQLAQMQAMARRGDVTLTNSYNGTDDASDVYPVGTTVVTWTATDESGNSASCDMNITVEDNEDPIAVCQNVTVQLDDAGTASITAGDVDGGSTDNCAIGSLTVTPSSFTCADVGSNTVTLTVTDIYGNTGSCTATVLVEDNIAPIMDCPANIELTANNIGCSAIVFWDDDIATDNCPVGLVVESNYEPGDVFPLGTTTVTYTATDASGNSASCSFDVTVINDLTITVDSVFDVSCFDGADGQIFVTISGGTPPYIPRWSNDLDTEDIENLIPGGYVLFVEDANGCTAITDVIIVDEPTPLVESAPAVITDASCDGGSMGAIDITFSGGTPPYTYEWTNGATTEDVTGLMAGIYQVTITDANGCEILSPVYPIAAPGGAAIGVVSVTDVDCNGASTGAIAITVTGGTPPYSYLWDNGSTDEDLTGIPAGDYVVTVTDANGCSFDSDVITVDEPTAIAISNVEVVDAACNGEASGSIEIDVDGGTPPYTYSWSNGETTQDIDDLVAGTYTGTITDANGCVLVSPPLTIGEPSAVFVASVDVTNADCNGASTGSIDIAIAGGTGPYLVFWDNGTAAEDLTGVGSGTYSATIFDNNGCQISTGPINVGEPTAIEITFVDIMFNGCNGDNMGSIDIEVAGGTAPYTYLWSNGETTQDLAMLEAGDYQGTITDANGCVLVSPVLTVGEASAIEEVSAAVTNPTCNTTTDGSIDITLSGGTAPYDVVWSDGSTDEDLSGVGSGTYSYVVTDANGCVFESDNFELANPNEITAGFAVSNVSCLGDNSGSIAADVDGGTAPYTYLWSNGETTEDLAGLAAGDYSVVITDANGCTFSSEIFTITEPASVLTATIDATNESFLGAQDGSASVVPSGGDAPYTYQWNSGEITQNITGVSAGIYCVDITDANGCVIELCITVGVGTPVIDIFEITDLNLYPNPTMSVANLVVSFSKAVDLEVELIDVLGRVLEARSALQVEESTFVFDVRDLPAATYFIRLNADGEVRTLPFIVQH